MFSSPLCRLPLAVILFSLDLISSFELQHKKSLCDNWKESGARLLYFGHLEASKTSAFILLDSTCSGYFLDSKALHFGIDSEESPSMNMKGAKAFHLESCEQVFKDGLRMVAIWVHNLTNSRTGALWMALQEGLEHAWILPTIIGTVEHLTVDSPPPGSIIVYSISPNKQLFLVRNGTELAYYDYQIERKQDVRFLSYSTTGERFMSLEASASPIDGGYLLEVPGGKYFFGLSSSEGTVYVYEHSNRLAIKPKVVIPLWHFFGCPDPGLSGMDVLILGALLLLLLFVAFQAYLLYSKKTHTKRRPTKKGRARLQVKSTSHSTGKQHKTTLTAAKPARKGARAR